MPAMNVDELIEQLQLVSESGGGLAHVIIEEEGLGYAGALLNVDTWLTGPGNGTLTLLGEKS
jgi:hypothetical protein